MMTYVCHTSTASRYYSYRHLRRGTRRSGGLNNFHVCARTEIETRAIEAKKPSHLISQFFFFTKKSFPKPKTNSVGRVEVLGADPASLIIRWQAAWMPTPAVTVLRCGCNDLGRRSLKTYPTWYVSCSSSSTSPPASSLPASSSTEMGFLKASYPRQGPQQVKKTFTLRPQGLMVESTAPFLKLLTLGDASTYGGLLNGIAWKQRSQLRGGVYSH